jgi:hypothetical protein
LVVNAPRCHLDSGSPRGRTIRGFPCLCGHGCTGRRKNSASRSRHCATKRAGRCRQSTGESGRGPGQCSTQGASRKLQITRIGETCIQTERSPSRDRSSAQPRSARTRSRILGCLTKRGIDALPGLSLTCWPG